MFPVILFNTSLFCLIVRHYHLLVNKDYHYLSWRKMFDCADTEKDLPSYCAGYGDRYSGCWPYVCSGLSSVRVDRTSSADVEVSPGTPDPGTRRSAMRPRRVSGIRGSGLGPCPPPCRIMSDPVPPVWAGMQLLFAATTPDSSLNTLCREDSI